MIRYMLEKDNKGKPFALIRNDGQGNFHYFSGKTNEWIPDPTGYQYWSGDDMDGHPISEAEAKKAMEYLINKWK